MTLTNNLTTTGSPALPAIIYKNGSFLSTANTGAATETMVVKANFTELHIRVTWPTVGSETRLHCWYRKTGDAEWAFGADLDLLSIGTGEFIGVIGNLVPGQEYDVLAWTGTTEIAYNSAEATRKPLVVDRDLTITDEVYVKPGATGTGTFDDPADLGASVAAFSSGERIQVLPGDYRNVTSSGDVNADNIALVAYDENNRPRIFGDFSFPGMSWSAHGAITGAWETSIGGTDQPFIDTAHVNTVDGYVLPHCYDDDELIDAPAGFRLKTGPILVVKLHDHSDPGVTGISISHNQRLLKNIGSNTVIKNIDFYNFGRHSSTAIFRGDADTTDFTIEDCTFTNCKLAAQFTNSTRIHINRCRCTGRYEFNTWDQAKGTDVTATKAMGDGNSFSFETDCSQVVVEDVVYDGGMDGIKLTGGSLPGSVFHHAISILRLRTQRMLDDSISVGSHSCGVLIEDIECLECANLVALADFTVGPVWIVQGVGTGIKFRNRISNGAFIDDLDSTSSEMFKYGSDSTTAVRGIVRAYFCTGLCDTPNPDIGDYRGDNLQTNVSPDGVEVINCIVASPEDLVHFSGVTTNVLRENNFYWPTDSTRADTAKYSEGGAYSNDLADWVADSGFDGATDVRIGQSPSLEGDPKLDAAYFPLDDSPCKGTAQSIRGFSYIGSNIGGRQPARVRAATIPVIGKTVVDHAVGAEIKIISPSDLILASSSRNVIINSGEDIEALRLDKDQDAHFANEVFCEDLTVTNPPWGSGSVDISGTPAVNQVVFWLDSDTIKGDSNLIWDGTNRKLKLTEDSNTNSDKAVLTLAKLPEDLGASSNNEDLGEITFSGWGGSTEIQGARILFEADESWSESTARTNMFIGLTPAGATEPVDVLFLESTGNFGLGAAPGTGSSMLLLQRSDEFFFRLACHSNTSADSGRIKFEKFPDDGLTMTTGEEIGNLRWEGDDGTASGLAAEIFVKSGGTWAVGDHPSTMEFWTTPDASATITKQLEIDLSGDVVATNDVHMQNLRFDETGARQAIIEASYLTYNINGGTRWHMDYSGHFRPETDSLVNLGASYARIATIWLDVINDNIDLSGAQDSIHIHRGSSNEQNIYLYNDATNLASDYERFRIDWTDTANVCTLGTHTVGGSTRSFVFKRGSSSYLGFYSAGIETSVDIYPDADGSADLGTSALFFGTGYIDSITHGTNAAITASVTQTQGQAPQTVDVIEVSVCANANDVITIRSAEAGAFHFIKNNGAQTLQIFPASGDNINGTGVNSSVTLAAGSSVKYYAIDATNWCS